MKYREIQVEGICTNNLKNVSVSLQKNAINLIVGPSGSGKSSLVYDTIAKIGQQEFFSMFADNAGDVSYNVASFRNMVVTVPIKQTNNNNNTHSTIGTYFGLNRCIVLLYSTLLNISEHFFYSEYCIKCLPCVSWYRKC